MQKPKRTLSFCFVAFLSFACFEREHAYPADSYSIRFFRIAAQIEIISTEADLIQAINRLDQPETRMKTLSLLCRFASLKLYNHGGSVYFGNSEKKLDGLQERAVAVILKHTDIKIVSEALDSEDDRLQFWGLWFWRTNYDTESNRMTEAWLALRPKVERLSIEGNDSVRDAAVRKLQQSPGTNEFLNDRIRKEKSAYVLKTLLGSSGSGIPDGRINNAFLGLLKDDDFNVREKALGAIGSNNIAAPVCQVAYDKGIFHRVIELTEAELPKERAIAAYALMGIRKIDLELSREAFIRLAKDSSPVVRWRAAGGLVDQSDREEVKLVVGALLKDSSSLVRYMTIIADGSEKHINELRMLAHDLDPEVAGFAASNLKRLVQDGKIIAVDPN